MKATYIIIYLSSLQLLSNLSLAQYNKSPATLGIDFNLNKYHGAYSPVSGVCINYTNGISSYYNYTVMFSGSFLDSAKKAIKETDKKLLLEGSVAITRKLVNPSSRFQPFLLAGVGLGYYNQNNGAFIPAGVGLQTKISNDIYATLNAQYRLGIASNLNSHYFFSIGIGGLLGKRNLKRDHEKKVVNTVKRVNAQPVLNSQDKDHDGIPDSADFCPERPGPADNHGCPVEFIPNPSVETLLDSLAKNILFETNSAILKPGSFTPLNEVAKILFRYPSITLNVEGHTDSVGTDQSNLTLSIARANAVANYLSNQGILKIRLLPSGFGELRPIADNSIIEGRMINRRVELKVKPD